MRKILSVACLTLLALGGGCSNEPFEEPHLTLHALCQSGDATPERIQAFLDLGVDVNALRDVDLVALELTKDEDRNGEPDDERGDMTALQLAAMSCDAQAVKYLIKAGADISEGGYGSRIPLQLASRHNSPAVVRVLIRAGSDVSSRNWGQQTPLHGATLKNDNSEVLEVLLEAGADVNAQEDDGWTPLLHAALHARTEAVEVLLEAGADVNAKDSSGWTPLHVAVLASNTTEGLMVLLQLLQAGADIKAEDRWDETPLHWAARQNANPEILKALLKAGADANAMNRHGQTPLDLAGTTSHKGAILREAGGKIGDEFRSEEELIAQATRLFFTHASVPNTSPQVFRTLLEEGADVNARNSSGRTPLHTVALRQDTKVLEVLLEAGADVNARDGKGRTPLHDAAERGEGFFIPRFHKVHAEVLGVLLKADADVNARDRIGRTPLDLVITDEKRAILRAAGGKTGAELDAEEAARNAP